MSFSIPKPCHRKTVCHSIMTGGEHNGNP